MITRIRWAVIGAMVLWSVVRGAAQVVPATETKALDGSPVVFPKSGSKKPLLLIIGFSHKSSSDLDDWKRRFKTAYTVDPRIDFYELVDLQGMPSFVKPMVLHGMRKTIKGEEQSHFAPFYSGEDEWKRVVHFSTPEDCYLVLANSDGRIVWQSHGPANDAKSTELESAITKLPSSPR